MKEDERKWEIHNLDNLWGGGISFEFYFNKLAPFACSPLILLFFLQLFYLLFKYIMPKIGQFTKLLRFQNVISPKTHLKTELIITGVYS